MQKTTAATATYGICDICDGANNLTAVEDMGQTFLICPDCI